MRLQIYKPPQSNFEKYLRGKKNLPTFALLLNKALQNETHIPTIATQKKEQTRIYGTHVHQERT